MGYATTEVGEERRYASGPSQTTGFWTRTVGLVLAIFLASSGIAQAQVGKLYPRDDAHRDSTFIAFRMHFLQAIAERDTTFLYAHLDPEILISFGFERGIPAFKEYWEPSSSETELWSELGRAVGGGGVYEDGTFTFPYYYALFPGEAFDAFQHGVIVGERVNVREAPSTGSNVLAKLSYDIVRVLDFFPSDVQEEGSLRWAQVQLVDGREGYVARRYIASPIDYRGRFVKKNGRWLLTLFVAGD